MLRFSLKVWMTNNRYFNNKNPDVLCVLKRWRGTTKQKTFDTAHVQFLIKLLRIDYFQAIKFLTNYKGRKKFSCQEIARTYAICVKYGINNIIRTESSHLLFFKPSILEQRICFFKDIGCPKIMLPMMTAFFDTLRLTVKELKDRQILPKDANVTNNLLSCLHEPPPDLPSVELLSDDLPVVDVHQNLLIHYLKWKLDLTEDELQRIITARFRIKYQSFSLLKGMLNLLENDLKFPKEKILKNHYLLYKSPTNCKWILEELKYIGNTEIKVLLLTYPRLLHAQVDTLHAKMKILKDFNVADEAISKYPDIFSLSTKTITRRLVEFKTMEEMKGHRSHPRFLTLIFYFEAAKRRIHLLRQLNVKCISLHLLTTSKTSFQKYIAVGSDRTKGQDLIRFLSYELGVDFQDVKLSLIKRHPMWCQIPIIYVQETYAYLKENNYPNEDILRNIQIVLYKRSHIEQELNKIDSSGLYQSWELTLSRKLALCLYNMEKKYHFDGNGVWNIQPSINEDEQSSRYLRHTSNV